MPQGRRWIVWNQREIACSWEKGRRENREPHPQGTHLDWRKAKSAEAAVSQQQELVSEATEHKRRERGTVSD